MNIYIWGTGVVVSNLAGRIIALDRIKGFIDNDSSKKEYLDKPVYSPEAMLDREYDAIVVMNIYAQEIAEQCRKLGLDLDRIIFIYNNFKLTDMNANYELAEKILGRDYCEIIKNRYQLIRKNEEAEELGRVLNAQYSKTDYVRIKTFELVTRELIRKETGGAVAEVGVARGEFAQYINAAFPGKKCYLFDTFEGFDEKEAMEEIGKENITEVFLETYKNIKVSSVMDKMRYPEQVIIKKGLFPGSLDGLEESFAFVSIDVDLERSIYDCLEYFYPRLEGGGYIFIHDYNSALKGVGAAVEHYEENYKVSLPKVPICDCKGTLVITK